MGLLKTITLVNKTDAQLSYLTGLVLVPAASTLSISNGILFFLFNDDSFIDDIWKASVSVSTSRGELLTSAAFDYLEQNITFMKLSQNSNDPITFSSAGYGFSITSEFSLGNDNESPILLLRNPNNSGYSGRALYIYAATNSTQGILTTRAYTAPTVTNTGSDISSLIQNNYAGLTNPPIPAIKAYSGPTVSANGAKRITLVTPANTSPPVQDFKQTAILGPNQDFLVTCQAANRGLLASLSCTLFMLWVEV